MATTEEIQKQVDENFESFRKMLPEIIGQHRDKYALMRNGEIEAYYSTAEDARITGQRFYEDGLFSVQKVTDVAVDLGFFSRAVPLEHV